MAKRYDVGRIDGPVITPQGYLKADALATRAGIFTYLNFDGSLRRELRHPDEVFNKDSLASLAGVAVTNDHPPEALNAENTRKYAAGFTGDAVNQVSDLVQTKITITDDRAIQEILSGSKQELSCGYECTVEMTPGMWQGMEYDAVQKEIRYNHLAIVKYGRAGPEARIRMDAADAMMTDQEFKKETKDENTKKDGAILKDEIISSDEQKKEQSMLVKVKIDGVEYEVSEEAAKAINAKIDSFKDAQAKCDALSGKADSLEATLKKKDEEIKSSVLTEAQILERADSIRKVHTLAKEFLGEDTKLDGLNTLEIKRQIVAKHLGKDIKDKNDSYVDGVFEGIQVDNKDNDTINALRNAGLPHGDVTFSPEAARLASMKRDSELWMKN